MKRLPRQLHDQWEQCVCVKNCFMVHHWSVVWFGACRKGTPLSKTCTIVHGYGLACQTVPASSQLGLLLGQHFVEYLSLRYVVWPHGHHLQKILQTQCGPYSFGQFCCTVGQYVGWCSSRDLVIFLFQRNSTIFGSLEQQPWFYEKWKTSGVSGHSERKTSETDCDVSGIYIASDMSLVRVTGDTTMWNSLYDAPSQDTFHYVRPSLVVFHYSLKQGYASNQCYMSWINIWEL